jgi:hypothetical protein
LNGRGATSWGMTRLLDSVRAALIKRHWNSTELLIHLLH